MVVSTVDAAAPRAVGVEIADGSLTATLADGRVIAAPLAWFPGFCMPPQTSGAPPVPATLAAPAEGGARQSLNDSKRRALSVNLRPLLPNRHALPAAARTPLPCAKSRPLPFPCSDLFSRLAGEASLPATPTECACSAPLSFWERGRG